MKLCEMAQEYRVNVALLELRIKQLQAAQKRARQPEVRYRLKQRAKFLQTLINESRQTVFLMEHYHDHSEEGDAHAITQDCRSGNSHLFCDIRLCQIQFQTALFYSDRKSVV